MSLSAFTDRNHRPTDAEVTQALGPRLPDWQALARFVREDYQAEEDWDFLYGDEYGWALRLERQQSRLAALFPAQGGFTVQIDLDTLDVEKAQRMNLGHNAQQAIVQAYPHPEGRSLFIPAETESDNRDIRRLLALRAESGADWLMMERMKIEFILSLSHEIRIPLNTVIGCSKLMLAEKDGPLTEDQRESLTAIEQAGWRILGQWDDFMDVHRLLFHRSPKSSFEEEVDLRQMVDNIVPIASRYARYYGHRPDSAPNIEVISDELPKIQGDVQMLERALTWTLEEVIGDQESKTLIKLTKDNNQVRLEITTTNHSISRLDYMLYFSKRIIALHKGDMQVQVKEWDEPEPGVMVTITLPRG